MRGAYQARGHGATRPYPPYEDPKSRVASARQRDARAATRRTSPPTSVRVTLLGLAHVLLRVKLHAELVDEIQLRLEEVDVTSLVAHQFLERVARRIALPGGAISRGFLIRRARV